MLVECVALAQRAHLAAAQTGRGHQSDDAVHGMGRDRALRRERQRGRISDLISALVNRCGAGLRCVVGPSKLLGGTSWRSSSAWSHTANRRPTLSRLRAKAGDDASRAQSSIVSTTMTSSPRAMAKAAHERNIPLIVGELEAEMAFQGDVAVYISLQGHCTSPVQGCATSRSMGRSVFAQITVVSGERHQPEAQVAEPHRSLRSASWSRSTIHAPSFFARHSVFSTLAQRERTPNFSRSRIRTQSPLASFATTAGLLMNPSRMVPDHSLT